MPKAVALRSVGLGLAIVAGALAGTAAAQISQAPHLHTNEAYVEEVMRGTTLDVNDPIAVFAYVLDSLPARVRVYPTENYYYFSFIHNGVRYAGNIRLDASNRDEGKLIFAYYEVTAWRDDKLAPHRVLDRSQGVTVEKLESLIYRVTYREKSVVFVLNDLSQVKLPPKAIGPDETSIGPIFDESAIRFFLIYNSKLKLFHYVLDETVKVADELAPTVHTDRILIGKRTGFAFYRDHRLDRKILIGVSAHSERANDYFDGPFDQLPDNFLQGETLRRIILDLEPGLKGQIDRFGGSFDGSIRYMIAPYRSYDSADELYVVHRCAAARREGATYYRCFVQNDAPSGLGARSASRSRQRVGMPERAEAPPKRR